MSNASFACFGFSCCVWIEGTSQADLLSSFSVLISPTMHAWDIDRHSWLSQLCGTQGPDLRICTCRSLVPWISLFFSVELILTAPVNDPHPFSSHPTPHPYPQPHHQGAWELITLSVTCPSVPAKRPNLWQQETYVPFEQLPIPWNRCVCCHVNSPPGHFIPGWQAPSSDSRTVGLPRSQSPSQV